MSRFRRGAMDSGLWMLGRLSRSRIGDNEALRRSTDKLIYSSARTGFQLAGVAARAFKRAKSLVQPVRPAEGSRSPLFDLTPTDEQAMVRDSMREFAQEQFLPVAQDADTRCRAPDDVLDQAAGLGLANLVIPEALGGAAAGRAVVTQALVAEALATGDMGLAVSCLVPASVATALSEWGSPAQQSTYLPAFAGERPPAAAIALLEPHPLANPFRMRTEARKRFGSWVLNGEKVLVPTAGRAEIFLVAAQADDGPALFLVEGGAIGVHLSADPSMGLRAAELGQIELRGVKLPASARIPMTASQYRDFVHRSRLAWCALSVGTAQAVLDYVIPYVNDRQAFGEPISHRQGVAFRVADIGIELEGMRLLTWRAAASAEQGRDFAHASALARRACTRHGLMIGSDGVQLLGGHGFVKEHPVERWYRDLRAVGIMEGGVLL